MFERRSRFPTLRVVLGLSWLSACNAVTGVNELEISDPGPTVTPILPLIVAPGVTMSEVALYQGVKRPLVADGKPAMSSIPIVAGRAALLRIFVKTDATYTGSPVTARLFLEGTALPLEVTQALTGSSTDEDLSSTLNFDLPGSSITTEMKYRIVLGESSGTIPRGPIAPIYPASDFELVPVESAGASLKILLVPVKYDADKSGRLPDLSEQQLKVYKDAFQAMYPVPEIELTVRDPFPWSKQVLDNGTGWGELLDAIASLREKDNAPPDLYYFGAVNPKSSFGAFCNSGCVAGLGMVGNAGDTFSRSALGLGYPGEDSAVTALHEIGHALGREHAPCDAPDPDPAYPYAKGAIGGWGYNLLTQQLYKPSTADIMGYCTPVWISDYTFKGFFTRIKTVNHARMVFPDELLNRMYDRVLVDGEGNLAWLPPLRLHTPPIGQLKTVVVESKGIAETLSGQYYAFDHLGGGILFWPSSERPVQAIRVDLGGRSVRLSR